MASIQRRPNGAWRARYLDPDGRERAQHFPTKADAEEFLARQRIQLRDGSWVDPLAGRRLFGNYATEWLEHQVHLRETSRRQKATMLRTVLLPAFGERPIVSITRSEVQAWVKAQTCSPATTAARYGLLAQVLLAAVEDRLLVFSPCRKINLPEVEQNLQIPTVEEVAAIIHAASPHGKAVVLVTAGTGMRISEVCGLTVSRVDFLRRNVTVDQQLVGITAGVPRFGPPKTRASNRTIPVPAELTDALAAHLAAWPSPDVVFRGAHGGPWRRHSLGEEWRRWCRHADVQLPFRALRHHYASALIHAGQSPKVVQERLGHKSITTTMDIYGHLFPADEDRTRDAIGSLARDLARTAGGLVAQTSRSGA